MRYNGIRKEITKMLELTEYQQNQYLNGVITVIEAMPVINDDTMYNLIVDDDTFLEQCDKACDLNLPDESHFSEEDAEYIGQQLWNIVNDAYDIVSTVHNVYHPPLFS
jgi:hypothetical protein